MHATKKQLYLVDTNASNQPSPVPYDEVTKVAHNNVNDGGGALER